MKKLIRVFFSRMAAIQTRKDYDTLQGDIDYAYQHGKISYADLETLFSVMNRIGYPEE